MRASSMYACGAALLLLLSLCAVSASASAASASGRVVSLSGEAEKGVLVRAIEWDAASNAPAPASTNTAAEETLTDASGAYVLRALQPGRTYRVTVQTAAGETPAAAAGTDAAAAAAPASRLARTSPEWQSVRVDSVSETPVLLGDFLAFRRAASFDLTGELVGLGAAGLKHLPSLEVQVALASSPGSVLRRTTSVAAGGQAYFEFLSLPAEVYVVSVHSSLPTRTYSFVSSPVTVSLAHASAHVRPVVEVGLKMSSVTEMQGNSLLNGLMIVAALAALLYRDKSAALLRAATKSVQVRSVAPLRNQIASMLPAGNGGAQQASASFAPSAGASAAGEDATRSGKKGKFNKKEKTHVSTFVRYDSLPVVAQPESPVAAAAAAPAPVVKPAPVERARPAPAAAKQQAAPQKSKPAPTPAPAPVTVPAPRAQVQAPAPVSPPVQLPSPPPAQVDKVVISKKEKAAPAPKAAAPAPAAVAAVPAPTPAPVSTGAKFCSGCGNRRPDANAKFCSECGTKY